MTSSPQAFRVFKQVPRILFGRECLARLNELLPSGTTPLAFVIDQVHRKAPWLASLSTDSSNIFIWVDTSHEPSTDQVDQIRDSLLAEGKSDLRAVIGIGGGSALDVAKAVAVMLNNPGSAKQYQGWDLVRHPAKFKIGIPTLSGSGSEASRTAVLYSADKKFGINSDFSMFDAILLDPNLIAGVPTEQRFYTAMDCYIHSVESLLGTMINDLARAYANTGLALSRKYFLANGTDEELMVASYQGGASVVNSEVGICHALSYGLSLELGFRHGIANCIAFDVLDEYYGDYVQEFREMMKAHSISLPRNVTSKLNPAALERMVAMTLRMERPLTNALGPEWRSRLTRKQIIDLYKRM